MATTTVIPLKKYKQMGKDLNCYRELLEAREAISEAKKDKKNGNIKELKTNLANLRFNKKITSKIKLKENNEVLNLNIEKLPEGYCLATSPDVRGLLAEAKTIDEAVSIARDIAKDLKELRKIKDREKKEKNR